MLVIFYNIKLMTWWNYSTILIDFCSCHNTRIFTPHTILFHLSPLSPLSFFFSFFISFFKFILFFQSILSLHSFSLLFSSFRTYSFSLLLRHTLPFILIRHRFWNSISYSLPTLNLFNQFTPHWTPNTKYQKLNTIDQNMDFNT